MRVLAACSFGGGGHLHPVLLEAAVGTVLAAPGCRAGGTRTGAEMAAAPAVDDALATVSPGPAR